VLDDAESVTDLARRSLTETKIIRCDNHLLATDKQRPSRRIPAFECPDVCLTGFSLGRDLAPVFDERVLCNVCIFPIKMHRDKLI
jgi:hypothetical protein